MADINVKVLTPATSFALMTLDELKIAMGIPVSNTASDPQLQWLIDTNSATIARLCNRVFAKEKVKESWRCQQSRRTFLSHFPVKEADIVSVTCNGVDNIDYELEEASGKVSIFSNRTEPIIVTYTGGYDLPTEAPLELKQAVTLMVATEKAELSSTSVSGVRMIAHKESRVMFHAPTGAGQGGGAGGAGVAVMPAVQSILSHFIRPWV